MGEKQRHVHASSVTDNLNGFIRMKRRVIGKKMNTAYRKMCGHGGVEAISSVLWIPPPGTLLNQFQKSEPAVHRKPHVAAGIPQDDKRLVHLVCSRQEARNSILNLRRYLASFWNCEMHEFVQTWKLGFKMVSKDLHIRRKQRQAPRDHVGVHVSQCELIA